MCTEEIRNESGIYSKACLVYCLKDIYQVVARHIALFSKINQETKDVNKNHVST